MDITTRLREVPTMGHDAGCVEEAALTIERLREALSLAVNVIEQLDETEMARLRGDADNALAAARKVLVLNV